MDDLRWTTRIYAGALKSALIAILSLQVILNENKQKTKVAESFRNPVFEEFSSTFIFPVRVATDPGLVRFPTHPTLHKRVGEPD